MQGFRIKISMRHFYQSWGTKGAKMPFFKEKFLEQQRKVSYIRRETSDLFNEPICFFISVIMNISETHIHERIHFISFWSTYWTFLITSDSTNKLFRWIKYIGFDIKVWVYLIK